MAVVLVVMPDPRVTTMRAVQRRQSSLFFFFPFVMHSD